MKKLIIIALLLSGCTTIQYRSNDFEINVDCGSNKVIRCNCEKDSCKCQCYKVIPDNYDIIFPRRL